MSITEEQYEGYKGKRMKIVIAPDSYKESLSALEVAELIQKGFSRHYPKAEYHLVPIADGGEGTIDAIVAATGGKRVVLSVMGPLGDHIEASYAITGDGQSAVIEMAEASGLMHVPLEKRDPTITTSFGTGELIKDALSRGIRHIVLGLGGSATNDGGAGMLAALGLQFFNQQGEELPLGAISLQELASIDFSHLDPAIQKCHFEIACDVDVVLTGGKGASAIFGPQKGATPEMITQLDCALENYARVIATTLQRDIDEIKNQPGSGAAGGMGVAALTFLQGELKSGVTLILELIGLPQLLLDADLVITGEGRMDGQTLYGKAPIGVATIAKEHHIPVIAIAGSLGDGAELLSEKGIAALFSILDSPCNLDEAYAKTRINLERTAENVAALLKVGKML